MKNIRLFAALLFAGFAFTACDNGGGTQEEPVSKWGKPLKVISYTDETGRTVGQVTVYSYDAQGRLAGYTRTNDLGAVMEEMYASEYSGNVHTYLVDSYEWVGVSLPVAFRHTDTYSDGSFTALRKKVTEGVENEGGTLDYERTTTYEYEDGVLVKYHTEGNRYGPWTTYVKYKDGVPSESDLPEESTEDDTYYDVIYTDGSGNRTGYFSGVNRGVRNWDFKYGNGYCSYLSRTEGAPEVNLVRVVFYPEIF